MPNLLDLGLVLGVLLCLNSLPLAQSADSDNNQGIVSISSSENMCNCSLSMSCTCCQTVMVNPLSLNKTLCLTFQLNILSTSVDITVTMDGTQISKFSISAKTPPTYCLPMLMVTPLAMCVKLHDIKLIGLTGIQICSTFYTSVTDNQIFAYAFPCVKLTTKGIGMV